LKKHKKRPGQNKMETEEKLQAEQDIQETEETQTEKKKDRKERTGILNIYTTFNNTIINLTDLAGTSIAKFSGGQSTKQDRLKANPTIAMFTAQKIAEEAKDNGLTGFYVKIRAGTGQANPGPGAHAAIKSLTREGFKILSIMDTTKMPRGGPKKPHGRRGRRV
jgi:small subunit ribosomal protein S11